MILLYNLYGPSQQYQVFKSEMKVNPLTRGYEGLTVVIDKQFKSEDCIKIIQDITASLTGTSASIYNSLSGQVMIGQVTIQVPEEWTDKGCKLKLTGSHNIGVRRYTSY